MKMRVSLLLVAVVAGMPGGAFGGDWNLIDLGTLGGSGSAGYTINNLGEVAGTSSLYGDSDSHAFIYSGGVMHDIAPIDSGPIRTGNFGLNDLGQVASGVVVVGGSYFAAIYDSRTGRTTTLGGLRGNSSSATAINNSGAVVGYSDLVSGTRHAFIYQSGTMSDLGSLGGYSAATAVNNSGMAAGFSSETPTGFARAVVWINNSLVNISQGRESHAFGINDLGEVVGDSWGLAATDQAFLWSNGGTMQSLGSLEPGRSSGAYDINNNGDVVGYGYVTSLSYSTNLSTGKITITTNTVSHGFLYENGAMIDLNSLISTNSGWVIQEAYSINDLNQILCEGKSDDGFFHSFILQVPEPSVSSLLICGSAGIIVYGRKRRKSLRARISEAPHA